MIALKDLHDATLLNLEVDWDEGDLRCKLDVSIGEITRVSLLARGLTFLKCPRQFPWGPSVSVNYVRVDQVDPGLRLVIEMQSGDVIEAQAADVSVLNEALE
jgi:hypothetical protein